jgi:hypothetical protein
MRSIIVLRLFAAMVLFSTVSAAQYFGQNKVRYEDYDFKVLSTDHFDIYYYQREADVMQEIGRMAERWYARLSEILDHDLSSRQALILYADAADFRSTTVIPGNIGEGTGGVTEGLRRRIVMPLAGPLAETDHVLGHELVHAFQYDMSRRTRGQRVAGINVLPLWFVEGMAEYLSLGPVDANTAMWMRDAVLRDEVPKIKDLADQEYFPYRYGHALWAYLGGRFGDAVVAEALRAGIERGDPQEALSRVTGIDEDKLSDQWRETLKSEYAPIIEQTNAPEQKGRVLVKAEERAGALNVSPAISPDSRYMMFLSERSLFAINLFLADARTGKVLKRITKSEINPTSARYSSLKAVVHGMPIANSLRTPKLKRVSPSLPSTILSRATQSELCDSPIWVRSRP